MIKINPSPERSPDSLVFQAIKEVCSVRNSQRVEELRKLIKLLGVRK